MSIELCDLRLVTFWLMVALKFYIQHLCRAISTSAANAIETDNSLAVVKVVEPHYEVVVYIDS